MELQWSEPELSAVDCREADCADTRDFAPTMTHRYWLHGGVRPAYPVLDHDLSTDVLIVGGGITGVTTAYLLGQAGLRVTLLERTLCGGLDTSATTAHLTSVTDCLPGELWRRFGATAARQVWEAGEAAIAQIESNISTLGLACAFRRVPGFLYAAHDGGDASVQALRAEQAAIAALSLPATFLDRGPVLDRPALLFPGQAQFHPLSYLQGLLAEIVRSGGRIYDRTEAENVRSQGGSFTVVARGYRVHAKHLVIATHYPWPGVSGTLAAAMLRARLVSRTSYVLAGRIPPGLLPEGCYWDNARPYRYLRVDQGRLLVGGEDHRTGQIDDADVRFQRLTEFTRQVAADIAIDDRWSGQVIESHDGMPLIGETAQRQFIATGFAGNGMTFGTLAAMMVRDEILGISNDWRKVFDIRRSAFLHAPFTYLKDNLNYPIHFAEGWLELLREKSVERVGPGQGRVTRQTGRAVAVYMSSEGPVLLSAVCPHMKCIVRWNASEQTWDCPCHGSRFSAFGAVLTGPATEPLESVGPGVDPS